MISAHSEVLKSFRSSKEIVRYQRLLRVLFLKMIGSIYTVYFTIISRFGYDIALICSHNTHLSILILQTL